MAVFLILDFGSQSTHLVRRRLQDLGFEAQVVSSRITIQEIQNLCPCGLIFSGSPDSVYEYGAQILDKNILDLDIPKLGICYGFQQVVQILGGSVEKSFIRELGRCPIQILDKNSLFVGIPQGFSAWMSHGDSITVLPEDFLLLAASKDHPAAAYHAQYQFFGVQFHPELSHCDYGDTILDNFAKNICKQAPSIQKIDQIFSHIQLDVQKKVGKKPVLLLISGGVDSSVVAAVLLKSLDPEQVYLMYLDTGLMRKNETAEVHQILLQLQAKHLHMIDAGDQYFSALQGVSDPEEKRRIIGNLFVEITEKEVAKLGLPDNFLLAQGTLYTDLIESGKGTGKQAHVIKSHHNVNSPLIIKKRDQGQLVEPLHELYKDQVRVLGQYLGLPDALIFRHPFPGPGLGIRVLEEVNKERVCILQEADAIYLEELKRYGLYEKIWQAFAVLIPVKSVGVAGDMRHYGYTIGLRAVTSIDGISAEAYNFDMKIIKEISARITNEVSAVARVVYDISSKPPATIEWE
ncbi:MAG: glutamine-hydrolyzing GMP synthase [Spirochaetia bacterium]